MSLAGSASPSAFGTSIFLLSSPTSSKKTSLERRVLHANDEGFRALVQTRLIRQGLCDFAMSFQRENFEFILHRFRPYIFPPGVSELDALKLLDVMCHMKSLGDLPPDLEADIHASDDVCIFAFQSSRDLIWRFANVWTLRIALKRHWPTY